MISGTTEARLGKEVRISKDYSRGLYARKLEYSFDIVDFVDR